MYNDEKRAGWLVKLFPQRILFEVGANRLMAAGILARPNPIECKTKFQPKFDPVQFQRWRATYQDVPEDIITQLAKNQERNDAIWRTYVKRRDEFGKTIIFADRWFQCDYLRERLRSEGVRADVVYSHVEADPDSVDARNRRSRDENAEVLQAFRDGKLDVLINVRMLTEGTDIPTLQSVFLTRQTTSSILLRQMVGRALRGPKFGGKATANIVLFMDNWREAIQWAEFDDLWEQGAEVRERAPQKRLPLQLVSIELVRRLAREMESGEIAPASFVRMLPLGWYVPEFDVEVEGTDDTSHERPMVLVFEDEKDCYEAFLEHTAKENLARFADPGIRYDEAAKQIEAWREVAFGGRSRRTSGLGVNLFHLVRHLAQTGGKAPPFFPFDDRDAHDLTPVAVKAAAEDWGPKRTRQHLEAVFLDERRFWRALYPTFDLFAGQFRHLVDGIIQRQTGAGAQAPIVVETPLPLADAEPREEVKQEVIRRDGGRCLCCGNKRRLEIDHIISRYHGGSNESHNLQTLCSICNQHKDIQEMHFRKTATLLRSAPPLQFPAGFSSADLDRIETDIRRTINMFYQCAAVDELEIGRRGIRRLDWRIRLRSGNPRDWFAPHVQALLDRVRTAQHGARSTPVRSIVLETNDDRANSDGSACQVHSARVGAASCLPASRIRPRMSITIYWPSSPDLPDAPVRAKVVRVHQGRKKADVSLMLGCSKQEILGVPFRSIFHPGAFT